MRGKTSSGHRILVVDDDRLVLAMLAEGLRDAGYQVSTADTAADAMRQALVQRPELVLLDMRLPDRPGTEVAAFLRQHIDAPVLFLSAYSDTDMVREAIAQGALGYLVKPLDLAQILPSIESALARGQEFHALLEEEAHLQTALSQTRATSMAVGMLMEREGLDERAAFDRLRQEARASRRRVSEVAEAMLRDRAATTRDR